MDFVNVKIGENGTGSEIHLCPDENLYTGVKKFIEEFGECNSLEEDLFNVAAGVYGADLSVTRHEREHFVRNINLSIDVVNYHAFERIRTILENALHIVSRDNWKIKFSHKKGSPVTQFDWDDKEGAVLLFSGGIDSMCAASEFLKARTDLVLVSHNTPGNTIVDKCQRDVHDALEKYYKTDLVHILF